MPIARQRDYLALTAVLAASFIGTPSVQGEERSRGCLYATYEGAERTPVTPCPDTDPLNIGQNEDVQRVIRALGIEPGIIRFRGCERHRFSAAPDPTAPAEERRYVITYPTEAAGRYLAPIAHELAHVLQFEMEGGLSALTQKYPSKRIELGADYLAGLVFSHVLRDIDINEFQHNILLMGLYVELDFDAHGTPSQRGAAFRFGYINFAAVGPDMRKASKNFQANLYGAVIQH